MKKTVLLFVALVGVLVGNSQNFNYDIKFHRLKFDVDPAVASIKGVVTTYFTPITGSISDMTFQLDNVMSVDSVKFRTQKLVYTHSNNHVNIQLGATMTSGDLDSIFVYYHGNPSASGHGSFITSTHYGSPIMWTLSEPYGAASWWPCKQILNDKADSVEMSVTVPKGNKVAGNGLIIGSDTVGNKVTVHWKHRYPITAYLAAFAVTNYAEYYNHVQVNDTLNIPILNYVYPEDLTEAQGQTPDVIDVFKFYCDSFGVYPFAKEKYGHAQFGWGGGMEHQTMSFMGGFGHSLMAHELAHQWFGDCITCGSWHHIWLNEGFATYLEGLTAEKGLAPYSWQYWKQNKLNRATSLPDGSVYCDDTTSVSRIFSSRLSYNKGAMIIHLLRWIVGDQAFFSGLRAYMKDPALVYGFAEPNDLKRNMEATSGKNLDEFFNDWYYGKGFPIYSINWYQNTDKKVHLSISQTQSDTGVDFFDAPLPIKFTGEGKDTIIVFDNNIQNQKFDAQLNFVVENVIFDPDIWIVTKDPVINKVVALDEINKKNFSISPNPVVNNFNVNFSDITYIEKYDIYDIRGNLIDSKIINNKTQKVIINCDVWKIGIYFVRFTTKNGTFNEKIIKIL